MEQEVCEIVQRRETHYTLEAVSDYYETIRESLESDSLGKWAVVANGRLVGVYNSNPETSEVGHRSAASRTTKPRLPYRRCVAAGSNNDFNASPISPIATSAISLLAAHSLTLSGIC